MHNSILKAKLMCSVAMEKMVKRYEHVSKRTEETFSNSFPVLIA